MKRIISISIGVWWELRSLKFSVLNVIVIRVSSKISFLSKEIRTDEQQDQSKNFSISKQNLKKKTEHRLVKNHSLHRKIRKQFILPIEKSYKTCRRKKRKTKNRSI